MENVSVKESVKEYYGDVLGSSDDLATDACCTIEDTPSYLRDAIGRVHPEVTNRYYGCGLVLPLGLEGARVLDLGCGAGRDVYILSQLVGDKGHVVGVDMTEAQLAVAREHQAWHADQFNQAKSNVTFLEGDIERLLELDLEPQSFDVIVSNCVINLCTNKPAVFEAAHALLKPGGEMYFADVYADKQLPPEAINHPKAHGECLAGALYWEDFISLAKGSGFDDPRLVTHRPLGVHDDDLNELLDGARFQSATYRLFKASDESELISNAMATYRGGVPHTDESFEFDKHNNFKMGIPMAVSGPTAGTLRESRFAPFFDLGPADDEVENTDKPQSALSPFSEASKNCCG
ncbi:MAG: methyltransferase domain-containing protein [Pseudomonadota bacterium]